MPFKVRYQIFCTKVAAPIVDTFDRTMAYVEFNNYIHNPQGDVYRLQQTVAPDGQLTKPEEYLFLVYNVRRAMNRYYNGGRKHEDLLASLDLEKQLDDWNKRTHDYIDSHGNMATGNKESYSFYVLVSEWRDEWKNRMRYRKAPDCDLNLLRELNKKCRSIEAEIDKYVKDKLNLI